MFFLFNFFFVQATITYDSGYFTAFDSKIVTTFDCQNGSIFNEQISFNQPFANPPQIILINEKSDFSISVASNESQILFSITTVTITYFELGIQCNQNKVWALRYRWYAIDDQRIEVINQFNVANFQNMIIPHYNPNALTGFISIMTVGYKGKISFNMTVPITLQQISSITPTNVSISISDPSLLIGNILSVGYQIILAEVEQLTILNTIWSKSTWTSLNIAIVPNTFFMIPQFGYDFNNAHIWRLMATYLTTNPIRYALDKWEYDGVYTPNNHKQVQLLYQFTQNYLPLYCNHFEVIENVDSSSMSTSVKMFIFETNQQFFTIGSSTIILEKILSVVNLEITVNCQQNQNIQSTFYIYISQKRLIQEKNHIYSCSPQYSIIKYNSRFKQQTSANSQLQIVITSNSLTITQIIYNQVISQQFGCDRSYLIYYQQYRMQVTTFLF